MHEAFADVADLYNEATDRFEVKGFACVIRADVNSARLTVEVGGYGPRGGWRPFAGGSIVELRRQRAAIEQAISFGEHMEERRQRWLANREEEV